jgi:hypothetical protein
MFRKTSPQRSLLGLDQQLDQAKRKRLERSWAHQYSQHALGLIDEERFAKYYDESNGRPNRSIRMIVSILVFKEMFDLTDEEALEQLEWNVAWHHALDLTPEEAHTCQKTLHNFRARVLADDEGAGLFESTTARIIEAAKLRTGRQRQDSTHILSNIRLLTRLGLFTKTITVFLEALRKAHPRVCARVPEELRARYLDREGYFADSRGSEAPRRLSQAALDVYTLVKQFESNRAVRSLDAFQLLERLYADQCEPPADEAPEAIELKEKPSSTSLQSPSDPDATYGHKGKGYETQLAETCEEDNPFQVVTAVEVHGAHESDQQHVLPMLDQIERTCGQAPDEMHADAGYAGGDNLVDAQEKHGTALQAPIGSKAPEAPIALVDFVFDKTGRRVLACPMEEEPVKHQPTRRSKAMLAIFSAEQCSTCPFKDICPTQRRSDESRVLRFTKAQAAVARRRVEQDGTTFKTRHKIRSGIEATNSEAKRRHGLAKVRVRGRDRVSLAVRLKMLAINVKRFVGHYAREAAKAEAEAALCAC